MTKTLHEVRCPIHGFIRFNNLERALIDSPPVQRLKEIHQLAMTYQVYPGATHRRFEHSLGVMELAGRAFDVVTGRSSLVAGAADIPQIADKNERRYWRQALRLAALLHDIGHLPFSHGAEKLLPAGWSHEVLTAKLILESAIPELLKEHRPLIDPVDVLRLAMKPSDLGKLETCGVSGLIELSPWDALLNELVNGDAFGVDRMDYLLRDAHHAGVPYGRFDPLRLLDNLVILPRRDPGEASAQADQSYPRPAGIPGQAGRRKRSGQPRAIAREIRGDWAIGIRHGGLHGVESLLVARYWMYRQLYFHDVRRAFDLHLIDVMRGIYPEHAYPTDLAEHLGQTDSQVLDAIARSTEPGVDPGQQEAARRIRERDHFRTAYVFRRADLLPGDQAPPLPIQELEQELGAQFDTAVARVDLPKPRDEGRDEVLVLMDDDDIVYGTSESPILAEPPQPWYGYVFADASELEKVIQFVREWRGLHDAPDQAKEDPHGF